ncbi:amino acid permease, partial [candidate division KSB1 bacterium]|nr:amino acid permease [candidate division KSB1 bacterium]
GEYIFLSRLYHPLFGFLSGWVSFIVGFSAPIAASALGFSEYLARAFPQIQLFGGPDLSKKLVAMAVILLFTVIHLRGIDFGAKIQNYLTVLKVLLIAALISLGFAFGKGDMGHFDSQPFQLNYGSWKTLGLSLMWIMFAYSGWNASVYIGSEIKNPAKTLPRSLFLGTGIVIFLYILLNVLYIYAVPAAEMSGVISIGGLAMGKLFNIHMETVFSLLIAFALFSSLSAYIILGPRVYFAMARDGYFFKSIARIHPKFYVPATAILLQGAISIIMVWSGTFDQILTYMGFSLGIFPILTVAGVFIIRRRGSDFKLPGYPVAQIFYIAIGLVILILSFLERPVESSVALLTVAVGVPVFLLFRRTGHDRHLS